MDTEAINISKAVVTATGITSLAICPLNGKVSWMQDVSTVSNGVQTFFTPAAWTFNALWIVLFAIEGVYITSYFASGHKIRCMQHIAPFTTLMFICQLLWFVSFCNEWYWTSLNIMFIMWKLSERIHGALRESCDDCNDDDDDDGEKNTCLTDITNNTQLGGTEKIIVYIGTFVMVDILFAWMMFMFCINTTVTLVHAGITASEDWAVSWMIFVFAWSSSHIYHHKDIPFTIALIIITSGIAHRYFHSLVGTIMMVSISLYIIILIASIRYHKQTQNIIRYR